MFHDHLPGDGEQKHLNGGAGRMLCQHLDKLHADDQVERVAQKHCKALVGFRIARKAEHLAHHLYTRDNNGDEHDDGNGDFNNACKKRYLAP